MHMMYFHTLDFKLSLIHHEQKGRLFTYIPREKTTTVLFILYSQQNVNYNLAHNTQQSYVHDCLPAPQLIPRSDIISYT